MISNGTLKKMQTELTDTVQYYWLLVDDYVHMNQLLDKTIEIQHVGYECSLCKANKKIWRQGFCYDCFNSAPQAGDWIMKPELSRAHLGIEDRDLAYEQQVQLKPHIVYLANSSNVKVGVTRKSQVPTRWIDQGAHEALAIVETPNRYLAGITEVALKDYVADKTNWRKMLTNDIQDVDLLRFRESVIPHIPSEVQQYIVACDQEFLIQFPVLQYPTKVSSVNLSKTPKFTGVVKGIKGQYLLFDGGHVMNVRNHEGYVIDLKIN